MPRLSFVMSGQRTLTTSSICSGPSLITSHMSRWIRSSRALWPGRWAVSDTRIAIRTLQCDSMWICSRLFSWDSRYRMRRGTCRRIRTSEECRRGTHKTRQTEIAHEDGVVIRIQRRATGEEKLSLCTCTTYTGFPSLLCMSFCVRDERGSPFEEEQHQRETETDTERERQRETERGRSTHTEDIPFTSLYTCSRMCSPLFPARACVPCRVNHTGIYGSSISVSSLHLETCMRRRAFICCPTQG